MVALSAFPSSSHSSASSSASESDSLALPSLEDILADPQRHFPRFLFDSDVLSVMELLSTLLFRSPDRGHSTAIECLWCWQDLTDASHSLSPLLDELRAAQEPKLALAGLRLLTRLLQFSPDRIARARLRNEIDELRLDELVLSLRERFRDSAELEEPITDWMRIRAEADHNNNHNNIDCNSNSANCEKPKQQTEIVGTTTRLAFVSGGGGGGKGADSDSGIFVGGEDEEERNKQQQQQHPQPTEMRDKNAAQDEHGKGIEIWEEDELLRLVDNLPATDRCHLVELIRHLASLPKEMVSPHLCSLLASVSHKMPPTFDTGQRTNTNGSNLITTFPTLITPSNNLIANIVVVPTTTSMPTLQSSAAHPLPLPPPQPPPPPPPQFLLQKLPSSSIASPSSLLRSPPPTNNELPFPICTTTNSNAAESPPMSKLSKAVVPPPPPPPAPPTAAADIPRSLRPKALPEQGRRLRHFQWAKIPATVVVAQLPTSALDKQHRCAPAYGTNDADENGGLNIWQRMDSVDQELRSRLDFAALDTFFGCPSSPPAAFNAGGRRRSSIFGTSNGVAGQQKQQDVRGNNNRRSSGTATANGGGTVCLLAPRRSLSVNVFLKLCRDTDQLIADLATGQAEHFGADRLRTLAQLLPTDEEQTMLKQFAGNNSMVLGAAEQFMLALISRVPEHRLRVEAMLFRLDLEVVLSGGTGLEPWIRGCKELMSSPTLRKVLYILLHLGNYLNHGAGVGNAVGFRLSSLWKVEDVKAVGGAGDGLMASGGGKSQQQQQPRTLLHFVAQQADNCADVLAGQLSNVRAAAKSSLEALREDLRVLLDRMHRLEVKIQAKKNGEKGQTGQTTAIGGVDGMNANDAEAAKSDQEFFDDFFVLLEKSRPIGALVEQQLAELDSLHRQVAMFFCESERGFSLEDCFKVVSSFLGRFEKAVQENCRQINRGGGGSDLKRIKEQQIMETAVEDEAEEMLANGEIDESQNQKRVKGQTKKELFGGGVVTEMVTMRRPSKIVVENNRNRERTTGENAATTALANRRRTWAPTTTTTTMPDSQQQQIEHNEKTENLSKCHQQQQKHPINNWQSLIGHSTMRHNDGQHGNSSSNSNANVMDDDGTMELEHLMDLALEKASNNNNNNNNNGHGGMKKPVNGGGGRSNRILEEEVEEGSKEEEEEEENGSNKCVATKMAEVNSQTEAQQQSNGDSSSSNSKQPALLGISASAKTRLAATSAMMMMNGKNVGRKKDTKMHGDKGNNNDGEGGGGECESSIHIQRQQEQLHHHSKVATPTTKGSTNDGNSTLRRTGSAVGRVPLPISNTSGINARTSLLGVVKEASVKTPICPSANRQRANSGSNQQQSTTMTGRHSLAATKGNEQNGKQQRVSMSSSTAVVNTPPPAPWIQQKRMVGARMANHQKETGTAASKSRATTPRSSCGVQPQQLRGAAIATNNATTTTTTLNGTMPKGTPRTTMRPTLTRQVSTASRPTLIKTGSSNSNNGLTAVGGGGGATTTTTMVATAATAKPTPLTPAGRRPKWI